MTSIAPEKLQELITKGNAIYDKAILDINRDGNAIEQLPDLAPNYQIQLDPISDTAMQTEYKENNYIHDEGKVILCMYNFAVKDRLFGKPGRLFWSDLMATCYSQMMAAHDHDTKDLEVIWRINIVNLVTISVIESYCEEDKSVELGPGNDGFFALLATDHGRGPARMLATYPKSVAIYWDNVEKGEAHSKKVAGWIFEKLQLDDLIDLEGTTGPWDAAEKPYSRV
ncbi:hypothetical protein V8C42DRAFT_342550 [Trichoderma barbatum]